MKIKYMSLLKYKNKKNQNSYDNFCVLLTATIKPFNINAVKRFDPKIREQDYLNSLNLWLTKTKFKIVFCENSGYDLKNIRNLCNKYPNRVEIIQFNLTDYSKGKDYCYGEFKIIEKAMNDSVFIKHSENIIKVTGRIFIENIIDIVDDCDNNSIINYTKHTRKDFSQSMHTMLFIFNKVFFKYLEDSSNLLEKMNFESFFENVLLKINDNGFNINNIKIFPLYIGVSGYRDIKYDDLFIKNKFELFKYYLLFYSGKIGKHLKSKTPFIYKILKPYFPDKQ